MLEKVKVSFGRLTVKIGLCAAILCFISQYMTWLTEDERSTSLAGLIAEEPDFFEGLPAMLIGGVLWIAVCFLLNHPKLTLIGVLPLLVILLAMLTTASGFGYGLGMGVFLYIIALVVCVVMAFATKKIKREDKFNEKTK